MTLPVNVHPMCIFDNLLTKLEKYVDDDIRSTRSNYVRKSEEARLSEDQMSAVLARKKLNRLLDVKNEIALANLHIEEWFDKNIDEDAGVVLKSDASPSNIKLPLARAQSEESETPLF